MPPRNESPRPAGHRSLFHSFRDAFKGVWRCLQSERNMRIHAAACGYVLFFAAKSGVHGGELACLLLAMGAVTAAEAMNTSVEKLCDFVENKRDPRIAAVKDMAAGAVVLSALFAALAGGAVLLRPELWAAVLDIAGTPWKLGAFGASALACALLIFAAPLKRE
ncbi:diacylglycerol kinase family protein [Acutalibacter sp. 1XD8-33]|uniref:diacylglycerol kinase family protein n=1 Tax=Acutalibacter sp. 1XD8-33 TaxID=2320081 RepID=UPI000EA1BD4F|nr:diacylglycerol kinase family protein [Acutalibacter sp. 1XD8-33]RKJ41419.1 diacylglycerol kinase family protein [Acutalibacter sp. 1XD8-33]